MDNFFENLYNEYEEEPRIRGLIEAISTMGFPLNVMIETLVGTRVKKMVSSRLRNFYDELNNGDIQLTDEIIENNDFLHAYFSVVNYVVRCKSDEKSTRFARIIKELYSESINIDQFEDYTAIFNDLTEREFAILALKLEYEKHPVMDMERPNPYKITKSYWDEFVRSVYDRVGVENEELIPILYRLQRTGCYTLHTGYMDMMDKGLGNTTFLFDKIYHMVVE